MIHPLRKTLVFVDDLVNWGWKLGPSSHLVPESDEPEALEALHAVAAKIGLRRAWFQSPDKRPHYDVTLKRREAALQLPNVCGIGCTAYARMRRIMRRGDFTEPGTGLAMKLDHWYIISDSGSSYAPRGWPTAEEAARQALVLPDYALQTAHVSIWSPVDPSKGLTEANAANIVRGQDMLVFWATNDYPELLRTETGREGS